MILATVSYVFRSFPSFLPIRQGSLISDCHTDRLRPHCDRRLRLEFHGAKVTSDAGLLACRDVGDSLGLTEAAAAEMHESRPGRNTRHSLTSLLRQAIYSRVAGYEDLNDAERFRVAPPAH